MIQTIKTRFHSLLFVSILLLLVSCEREFTEDVTFATNPTTGDIFTDDFIGLGTDFFFPFVSDGAKPDVFTVDRSLGFESDASIRIDVPNADDPSGNFAGAIFIIDGSGRNLTQFDALTFYARASSGAPVSVGFGENIYQVETVVSIGPGWFKYIIPIPDASKLTDERGMLFFSAGTQHNDGVGYSFWLDNVRFEKLNTIAQQRPSIMGGQDVVQESFIGVTVPVTNLTSSFNLGSGLNQTLNVRPSYYQFSSSNPSVAIVNELGQVSVMSEGTTVISAILNGVAAEGSLTINSLGNYSAAPVPTRPAENVISIFSDAYTNVPVDFFNGFFGGSSTQGGAINIAGDNVISYTDLNFVSVQYANPTVDASQMTHLHVDINVQQALSSGDQLIVELADFGPDNVFGGGNDSFGAAVPAITNLRSNEWVSLDIPISSFTGGTGGGGSGVKSTSNLAQTTFVSGTISSIFVDNIYFYKE